MPEEPKNGADPEATPSRSRPDGSKRQPTAAVIGSSMIDIIALVAPENIERVTMQNGGVSYLLLEQGRKVPAEGIETHVGGGGCNVSVSLARRGWQVRLLSKTGDDLNASAVRAHLSRNGVDTRSMLNDARLATGVSVMVSAHDRNAALFVHRGANEHLAIADITDSPFRSVDLVYIAPLSSGSADCFSALVEHGCWAGAMVAANPGIRQLTSRTEAFFGALGNLDLLSLNTVEAAALVPGLLARGATRVKPPLIADPPLRLRLGLSFGGHDMSLFDFFDALHGHGPDWVLLTDGAEGAYLSGPQGVMFCPAVPSDVAGTAGAGDAFCSTLASELAVGLGAERALLRASLNAASVVSKVNTTDGLLDAAEIEERAEDLPMSVRILR
ncbi:MAG: carbohydrate kinase family protein [Pseudomonadota bacterium]